MISKYKFEKIEALLQSDGEDIKQQLIFAGLLLMIFEQFKKFVISKTDYFFSDLEYKEGSISYKRGQEFKEIIKKFGKGTLSQHNNNVFRGGLYFFSSCNAITNEELNEIERLYLLRNDIGHELFNIVVEDCKPLIKIKDIYTVINIYNKLNRWCLKEMEPMTGIYSRELGDDDTFHFEEAESFETIVLKRIIWVTLFNKEERKKQKDLS